MACNSLLPASESPENLPSRTSQPASQLARGSSTTIHSHQADEVAGLNRTPCYSRVIFLITNIPIVGQFMLIRLNPNLFISTRLLGME